MLWVAWRQQRIQIVAMLGLAIVVAVGAVVLGGYAQRLRIDMGVDSCVQLPTMNYPCSAALEGQWRRALEPWRYLPVAFYLVPALVASFIGGPLLAREFERGTHRMAWTQGIGRVRWAATTLGLLVACAVVAGGIVAASSGQLGPPRIGGSQLGPRGAFDTFDFEGPAFISYVVFGLVAGAFFGTWSRRILVGMFVGLLVFGSVRVFVLSEVRPRYEPPVAIPMTRAGTAIPNDAWNLGPDAIDGQGRPVSRDRVGALVSEFYRQPQPVQFGRGYDPEPYLAANDVYQRVLYQPADRYWTFQWIETGIFLALSGVLALLTLVLVRRRDA